MKAASFSPNNLSHNTQQALITGRLFSGVPVLVPRIFYGVWRSRRLPGLHVCRHLQLAADPAAQSKLPISTKGYASAVTLN